MFIKRKPTNNINKDGTERKKGINGKDKGDSYERDIAFKLGNWWNEKFHRVPMSGGLHWGEDSRVAGDIVTHVSSLWPFCVECKKREEWNLEELIKDTGNIESWWLQTTEASDRVGLKPMLIFSKNRAPNYVMMRRRDFYPILRIEDDSYSIPFPCYEIHKNGESRVIFVLEKFINSHTKEEVLAAYPFYERTAIKDD